MGWYITCEYCGETEKYAHPSCKCIEERRNALLQKITGSTVISNFIQSECYGFYTFLYTQYKKGEIVFWVRTVLANGSDEGRIYEIIKEVSEPNKPDADDVDVESGTQ